ncbi:MAG: hypothetical protein J7L53_05320, partial [Deltaproteobacteria bacterium]|nr:hypothetical protein [Deltaproteobacteria bacterium]
PKGADLIRRIELCNKDDNILIGLAFYSKDYVKLGNYYYSVTQDEMKGIEAAIDRVLSALNKAKETAD